MRNRAGLQRLAGVAGSDVLAIAEVNADVPGPPHEIARARFGGRDGRTGVALGAGAAGNADSGLLVDVPGEAGAIEATRVGAAPHVGSADITEGDVNDGAALS